jgi:hypothetical protein
VLYVDAHGREEPGIDMGGLFKDFWTDLSALAFDENFGLFRATGDSQLLYPSPAAALAHGEREHTRYFEFVGRVLGKALFERITVSPKFAHFFLSFMGGNYNYLHMLADLESLDAELHRNLMFLKTYDGDVADLCLTFTVTHDELGAQREVPLVPRGAELDVTNENRFRYINLVAKHHLVDRLQAQSRAFVRGLAEVIDLAWLRMFNEPELQAKSRVTVFVSPSFSYTTKCARDIGGTAFGVDDLCSKREYGWSVRGSIFVLQVLISGATARLDVEDLRKHTRYSGGYTPLDKTVRRFWKVLETFEAEEGEAFLRFVTSCPRPPPLGFEALAPTFCLHRVPVRSDGERLPTASTCFNTLKLPTYSSEKALRLGLLTSITSGAGFDLS